MTIKTLSTGRTSDGMAISGPCRVPFPRWPSHSEAEIAAVAEVLRSGRTNQWTGPEVANFEEAFGELVGRPCLAVANGTLAIELCLRGLGIGSGDEVLAPARSYVADAATPVHVGARTTFVDVDVASGNVTVESLEAGRTEQTRAAIVVHLAGWPCDMLAIMEWAGTHGVLIIEDCAQAHGARVGRTHVGSFGHAAAFSFCQDKIMSTGGEGGMVCIRDSAAFDRAWSWRDHGKSRVGSMIRSGGPAQLGSNLRMTGMQAAIGLKQFGQLADWTAIRTANASVLREALADVPWLGIPWPGEGVTHGMFMLGCLVDPSQTVDRDALVERLRVEYPVRTGRVMDVGNHHAGPHRCSTAAALAERTLFLPVHPTADRIDMERLADAIRDAGP